MPTRKLQRRREFGTVRKLPSGRWQARYLGPDGQRHNAPETFDTKTDAQDWLNLVRADIERDHWRDPDAGAINFAKYALRWMEERGLAPTTVDRYDGLLRLHLLPAFGSKDLDEITPPSVRTWRAERLKATGATTVAKSYRLLKAILQTAVDDDLLRTNPCRIKGAGREEADERPTATVEQVFELADALGPRWRLMVLLGAFASLRPEELAELRRRSVDLDECSLRITHASPELTNGRRVTGDPESRAGKRTVYLPDFLLPELRRHVQWFAEKEPDGLLFVGEKGAPFRRSTFGRKWRKARTKVGLPDNFQEFAPRAGVVVPHLLRPKQHVSVDPDTQGGQPVITGTRVPFDAVAELVEDGVPLDEIAAYYPGVTVEAARDAVSFALYVDSYSPGPRAA